MGKNMCCLPDKKNKISSGFPAVATAQTQNMPGPAPDN